MNNYTYKMALVLFFTLIITSCSPRNESLKTAKTWVIDKEYSLLSIITTKNDSIAEVSDFKNFSGQINENGQLKIVIDLMSLETNIPIRNTRIQNHLFQTDIYKTAEIYAQLKPQNLKEGVHNITFDVDLHGVSVMMNADFMVFEQHNKITAVLYKPMILDAKAFGFENGINTLKNLANLISIDFTIPINLVLTFKSL